MTAYRRPKARLPSPPEVNQDRRDRLISVLARLQSRRKLIVKLLNPLLTMHDASLLLDLSQTTIRRATENGSLKNQRTAGGQRRFRLLDLLEYMDRREGGLLEIFVASDEQIATLRAALKDLEEDI
ncbi:helix-turn-helix domain-containing protein [bacterium]|nr:helix-turn-helix domain-containing protein [bacterium]